MRRKVILFGIDGASWDLVNQLIAKSKLPNFKKLQEHGGLSILTSTLPPSSPPAWNSLFSGVHPGRHGIFDFVKNNLETNFIEPMMGNDRKVPLVWDYLTKANKKTVAVNIPFVYPPHRINGILITGLGTPSKHARFASEPWVQEYIAKQYPDYDIDFGEHMFDIKEDKNKVLDRIDKLNPVQLRLAKDLFLTQQWDFFAVVVRSIDVVQHYFFDDTDILAKYYQEMDHMLGWIMQHMDTSTLLMVCSDHGFQKVKHSFSISNWLVNEGYLHIRPARPVIVPVHAEKIERLLKQMGLAGLVWKLKHTKLLRFILTYVMSSQYHGLMTRINWDETSVYHLGTTNGLLYINQEGREKNGIVERHTLYKLYNEIKQKLMKLTYHNDRVFKGVYFKDDIYPGGSEDAPDIILIVNEGFVISGGLSKDGSVFSKEKKFTGDHAMNGILGMYYTEKKGTLDLPKTVSMYDITPTILKELGVSVDTRFDGIPLSTI